VFWAACGADVAFALLAAILWSTPIAALVGAVLGAFAVRAWLAVRVQRRRRAFDDQLPELLGEIAAALRAGHGFNQALQAVAADAAEPARSELQRVIGEAQLGRPMEEALTALGRRIRSADLDFVLDAVIVQRQVGGSLAGIVALVGDAVRQRHQYAMRLRSITATGRLSATVLLALPLALGLFLTLLHHAYFAPLLHTGMGRAFVAVAAVMYAAGALWLRRITAVPGAPE
jgi:tight adherence protein B